jgi:hypothetical protein
MTRNKIKTEIKITNSQFTLSEKEKNVMKALKLNSTALAMTFLVAFSLADFASSAPATIKHLYLYDAQDNFLMYVDYEYDASGKDTCHQIYFSDGTFTRRVKPTWNSSGMIEKEVALNFTEDTVFNSSFTANGGKTDVVIKDQFKVDQLGGPVNYSKTADLEYTFQNGSYPYKIKYEYSTAGEMKKVNVFDADGKLAYYGEFSTVGVMSPTAKRTGLLSKIALRGNNALTWQFTLDRTTHVKCEAMSLSGRRIAVLYSGSMAEGTHLKTINLGSAPSLTNGAYVAVMSIDNKPVARTKFIVQRIRGGVR